MAFTRSEKRNLSATPVGAWQPASRSVREKKKGRQHWLRGLGKAA
jgi:hypothetical protein